ncbi:uncharacterized protein LOC122392489 [Amphibalanus amphitrite]|uniref:uncharacterized protein LOC122392489 n=1 Tax=Amphibalanus amphitrite TaxID=1232801 RepID=UPI001C904100|nr:uncharacterized protein LOC122392489 [Amphibalanus amphitrite]
MVRRRKQPGRQQTRPVSSSAAPQAALAPRPPADPGPASLGTPAQDVATDISSDSPEATPPRRSVTPSRATSHTRRQGPARTADRTARRSASPEGTAARHGAESYRGSSREHRHRSEKRSAKRRHCSTREASRYRRRRSPSLRTSDSDWTESDTPSDSSSDHGRVSRSRKRSKTQGRQPITDFLDMSIVPRRSQQPPPPRGLKLPTVSATALKTLADRSKVASVEAVVFPHAPSDGPRGAAPTRYPPLSPAAYMRGVTTIAAYRTYFFPAAAVQWATYLLWIQSRGESLPTSALRDLDERARTHMATYGDDYHDAASLTESTGLAGGLPPPAAPTAAASSRYAGPAAQRPGGAPNELCLRYNGAGCYSGGTCKRQHACTICRGPHPARQCLMAAPGQPGSIPHRPALTGPRQQKSRWH